MGWFARSFDDDLRDEVRRASEWCAEQRGARSLSNAELALGFAAFFYWLLNAFGRDTDPSYVRFANDSARKKATELIKAIMHQPQSLAAVSRKVPSFDPDYELLLSMGRLFPGQPGWEEWENCTTRATILLTRRLAYELCEEAGFTSVLVLAKAQPQFHSLIHCRTLFDLADCAAKWLNAAFGSAVRDQFFTPELLDALRSKAPRVDLVFPAGRRVSGAVLR